MTRSVSGLVLFVAALGMMAGLLGAEIAQLNNWDPVLTPAFLGKALIHIATVITAYISGQLVPTSARLRDITTPKE